MGPNNVFEATRSTAVVITAKPTVAVITTVTDNPSTKHGNMNLYLFHYSCCNGDSRPWFSVVRAIRTAVVYVLMRFYQVSVQTANSRTATADAVVALHPYP